MLRRKIALFPMVLSEEACGIPDIDVVDVIRFGAEGEPPVLAVRFCAWCGTRREEGTEERLTAPVVPVAVAVVAPPPVAEARERGNGRCGPCTRTVGDTVRRNCVGPDGADRIGYERAAQSLKWSAAHDDQEHPRGELSKAAATLILGARMDPTYAPPWASALLRKHYDDMIARLVIAGALCAAEIDRLLRIVHGGGR